MAKTRGAAGTATRAEVLREEDGRPRQGDPFQHEIAGDQGRGHRPGVNDASAATDEAIARRAFELYQARGGTHGADVDDWLQAEQELRGSIDG